jgi:GxxExxY protein
MIDPAAPASCATNNPSLEEIAGIVVDCGYRLHRETGPGLLESVYVSVLCTLLEHQGLRVKREFPVPIEVMGIRFIEGFRADLLIEDRLLIELKSVDALAPVHFKQVLTYLRLLKLPLGFIINFGAPTFKEGIKRIANSYNPHTPGSSAPEHREPPGKVRLM